LEPLRNYTKLDLESLIKIAETVELGKGTTINININSSEGSVNTSSAQPVDKLESLDLEQDMKNSSVDEETKRQALAHLNILKGLMVRAKQVDKPAASGKEEVNEDIKKVEDQGLEELRRKANTLAGIPEPNQYVANYDKDSSPGILGVNSAPNKGSGESMNAYKELLARLTNKSMMGTSGSNELQKMRSDDPEQEYST